MKKGDTVTCIGGNYAHAHRGKQYKVLAVSTKSDKIRIDCGNKAYWYPASNFTVQEIVEVTIKGVVEHNVDGALTVKLDDDTLVVLPASIVPGFGAKDIMKKADLPEELVEFAFSNVPSVAYDEMLAKYGITDKNDVETIFRYFNERQ